jgi:hypothetical protein
MLLKSGCCFYLFLRFQLKLETQLNIIIVEKNSSSAAAQDRKYKRSQKSKKKFILTNVGEICGCFHASMKSSPSWFYDVKIKKKQEKTRVKGNST